MLWLIGNNTESECHVEGHDIMRISKDGEVQEAIPCNGISFHCFAANDDTVVVASDDPEDAHLLIYSGDGEIQQMFNPKEGVYNVKISRDGQFIFVLGNGMVDLLS